MSTGTTDFIRDIMADGSLQDMLSAQPERDLPSALARLAVDRGYRIGMADLKRFLAGHDARFC